MTEGEFNIDRAIWEGFEKRYPRVSLIEGRIVFRLGISFLKTGLLAA